MSTAARAKIVAPAFHAPNWGPWLILTADVLALQAALGLGLGLRQLLEPWIPAAIGIEQYRAVAIGILLLPLVHYQLGIYPGYLLGPVERLRRRTLATLAVFGGLAAWDNIVARGTLSRGVLVATFVFALVLPPLVESMARKALIARKHWGIPAVILGAGSTARIVARTLLDEPALGLVPIAFLDNHAWDEALDQVPIAGPLRLAEEFERRAEAAIVVLPDLDKTDVAELLQELNFPRVIVIPQFTGIASLWVTARDLGGCLGLEIKKNLLMRRNLILKRTMDRLIAMPLILISAPVMAVAAVWIKIASRGPAFYCQMREGADGKHIAVWKLRTMHVDGEVLLERWFRDHPADRVEWSRYFKLRHDPRVLPCIGSLLRRTSLDELPQLWSVLKGEMSLVGPRPFPDYHLERFPAEFRALRSRVLPGLTGMWQVSARSEGDLETQEALDTFYIRNWSPWLDLYILARTAAAVLTARGAY